MTFNYTDEQLNNLNQDYAVYSVNEEFSSRKKTKQVVDKANIDPKNETNTITTTDGQEFRVVATKFDSGTGFDGACLRYIFLYSRVIYF